MSYQQQQKVIRMVCGGRENDPLSQKDSESKQIYKDDANLEKH